MNFLALPVLAGLGLLASTAVVVWLLYLLKPPARHVVVSSRLLWARVLSDQQKKLDRWRWLISLLLALLIALLIALALTRPEFGSGSGRAQRLLLTIDTSRSMAARCADGGSRLTHALSTAQAHIAQLGAASEVWLADTTGQLPAPVFEAPAAALLALTKLAVDPARTPRLPAMPRTDDARLARVSVLITDGVAALTPAPGTTLVSVFESAQNFSITAFEVQRLATDPHQLQAFVDVANFGTRSGSVELTLDGAGGQRIAQRLNLDAGRHTAQAIDVSRFAAGALSARLHAPDDAYTLDDLAYAYLPPRKTLHIALVTRGNDTLVRALKLQPHLHLSVLPPARYAPGMEVDAWVFDRFAPASMPTSPALLFAPPHAPWLPAPGASVDKPELSVWQGEHPVLQHLSLRDVAIEHANGFRTDGRSPAQANALIPLGDGQALAVASERGTRWVALGFALEDSNFALHAGFPAFLNNALTWLTGEALAVRHAIGPVELPEGTDKVLSITGAVVNARQLPDGRKLFDAPEPGFYTVNNAERSYRIAVGLADARASAINQSSLASTPLSSPPPLSQRARVAEPWMLCAGLAVLLLMLEWWTYHRRMTL